MKRVFISYSSKDRAIVAEIVTKLEAREIDYWIDSRNIEPGRQYANEIVTAIENSDIFLLILSKNSNDSRDVANELGTAFRKCKRIIPFKLDDVIPSKEIEYFLGSSQWVDARNSGYEQSISLLVNKIEGHINNKEIMINNTIKLNTRERMMHILRKRRVQTILALVAIIFLSITIINMGKYLTKSNSTESTIATLAQESSLNQGDTDNKVVLNVSDSYEVSTEEEVVKEETVKEETVVEGLADSTSTGSSMIAEEEKDDNNISQNVDTSTNNDQEIENVEQEVIEEVEQDVAEEVEQEVVEEEMEEVNQELDEVMESSDLDELDMKVYEMDASLATTLSSAIEPVTMNHFIRVSRKYDNKQYFKVHLNEGDGITVALKAYLTTGSMKLYIQNEAGKNIGYTSSIYNENYGVYSIEAAFDMDIYIAVTGSVGAYDIGFYNAYFNQDFDESVDLDFNGTPYTSILLDNRSVEKINKTYNPYFRVFLEEGQTITINLAAQVNKGSQKIYLLSPEGEVIKYSSSCYNDKQVTLSKTVAIAGYYYVSIVGDIGIADITYSLN